MMKLQHALFAASAALLWPGLALADPCEAPLPEAGAAFGGQVRYVGDGDSLCVGASANPADWIEVRLADFYAPELAEPGGEAAKRMLTQLVRGRALRCVAGRRSYDRVVARCTLDGADVGDLMREAGAPQGGRGAR